MKKGLNLRGLLADGRTFTERSSIATPGPSNTHCRMSFASFVVQAARLHWQAGRLHHETKAANFKWRYANR